MLYGDALRRLAGRFLDLEEPAVLEATDDAYEVWHAWWSKIEPRRAPGGDLAHLTPWLAKAEAAVWRLAGLITVADDPGARLARHPATFPEWGRTRTPAGSKASRDSRRAPRSDEPWRQRP